MNKLIAVSFLYFLSGLTILSIWYYEDNKYRDGESVCLFTDKVRGTVIKLSNNKPYMCGSKTIE